MITAVTSLALASVLTIHAAVPQPDTRNAGLLTRAVANAFHSPALAPVPGATFQNGSRDSLTNGAIIGAIAGGVLGLLGGATGCGYGEILDESPDEESCTGQALVGALVGASLGSLIGVGVDAMFERAPHLPAGPGARRTGVRIRWRF